MKRELNPLHLAQKLIAFNTANPPGQEKDCAQYVGKLLEDGGFNTGLYEFARGRTSVVAKLEGHGPSICFTGHMDTVPFGSAPWNRDPLGGEVDGNKLYGRGSSDMKGGLAAMVVAALNFAGRPNRGAGLTLVLTAGEETGCRGARYLAELQGVLGEAGAMVIGEPTSNYPLIGHKGVLWLEAKTTGLAAHGSMPERGVNAIYKAARAISALEKYAFNTAPHPSLGSPTLNVGLVSGGMNINSVPDKAVFGIDVRTVPGQSNQSAFEELKSYLGDEVEFERLLDLEGIWTDPQHEWVLKVFEIMEKYLKEKPEARSVSYFTDGSVLAPAFKNPPAVILGPGDPAMAHKTDECCCVSKIEEIAEAYVEIAEKWRMTSLSDT